MAAERMRVLHPGWDPRRNPRDRRRRPRGGLLLALVMTALVVAGTWSLLRAVPDTPPQHPAFPPEAFTEAPLPPREPAPTVRAWHEGSAQVHPPTRPTSAARAAGPAEGAPECGVDDLSVVADGWDAAVGDRWASLVATNVSDDACLVGGWPSIRLGQPDPLAVTVVRVSEGVDGRPAPPRRLVLEPGAGASVRLWWRGYGTAADQETPQRLIVRFGGGDWREVPLEGRLLDVVDGAEIEMAPWEPVGPDVLAGAH